MGLWREHADPLLTNTSVFPIWSDVYGYRLCEELVRWAKEKSATLRQQPKYNMTPVSAA
jgi:hypothetical protein